jgi:hypothetical protein
MKNYCLTLVSVVILMISPWAVFAVQNDTGAATVYKVTVTKFEMYNGSSWITVSDGSSTVMDIASVTAGQVAGNFFSGLNVPDGSYTQVRVTISPSFTISGSVGSDGSTIYTTATLSGGACVSSASSANQAECTVSVPGGLPDPTADVLPTTLVITGGVPSHKIRVNFDVSAAVQEGAGETLVPGNPTVTMQMIALQ